MQNSMIMHCIRNLEIVVLVLLANTNAEIIGNTTANLVNVTDVQTNETEATTKLEESTTYTSTPSGVDPTNNEGEFVDKRIFMITTIVLYVIIILLISAVIWLCITVRRVKETRKFSKEDGSQQSEANPNRYTSQPQGNFNPAFQNSFATDDTQISDQPPTPRNVSSPGYQHDRGQFNSRQNMEQMRPEHHVTNNVETDESDSEDYVVPMDTAEKHGRGKISPPPAGEFPPAVTSELQKRIEKPHKYQKPAPLPKPDFPKAARSPQQKATSPLPNNVFRDVGRDLEEKIRKREVIFDPSAPELPARNRIDEPDHSKIYENEEDQSNYQSPMM